MSHRNASTIRTPDWAKTYPCRRLSWIPVASSGDPTSSGLRPCWIGTFRAALGHVAVFGALAAAAVTTTVTEASNDLTLQQEIDAMRAEIAALRAASGDQWLTEQRAGEIRSLVQDVLADADSRASLQGSGMTAGWDNGFFLASPDGNYRLNIGGYGQFRYYYNRRDDPGAGQDSNSHGFENTRTHLSFSGHVVDPSWSYMVSGEFGNEGNFSLLDAYVVKSFDNGLFVIAGQFKVPMLRETLVDDTSQLAVERSLIESEFGAGRTQGAAIGWSNDFVKVVFGYTDGHPATGGFNTPALAPSTEWSFTGRADVKLAGTWAQWNQLTSFPGEEFAAFLGAAAHYQRSEFGTPDPELDVFLWTVDGSLQFGGASLYGAFVGRHIESVQGSAVDLDQYGFIVQGGFFVLPEVEIYGRYEWGDTDGNGKDLSVLTVGANWYIAKQALKLTADLGYGFNEVSSFFGDGLLGPGGGNAGWQTDGAGEDGQFVFRTQFQFAF